MFSFIKYDRFEIYSFFHFYTRDELVSDWYQLFWKIYILFALTLDPNDTIFSCLILSIRVKKRL